MKRACPQRCEPESKVGFGGLLHLDFRGKYTIRRTECGINIRIGEAFYETEIRRRFPEDTANGRQVWELNDCDQLEASSRLVFCQLRRSLDAGITSEMYYESKVLELLFLLGGSAPAPVRRGSELSDDDKKAVNAIREIIDVQFCRCPKIAELAVMANTSPAKLQRDFKAAFGRTIHKYLLETRMAKALELFERSDTSIGMIAKAVGCAKPGRFSEVFKATYGVTPTEYRRGQNGKVILHIGEPR